SSRSSMSSGFSWGTLASAAVMICAVRSSARRSFSDPLKARPMGERAVATMTASGMLAALLDGVRGGARTGDHVITGTLTCAVLQVAARGRATRPGRRRHLLRGRLGAAPQQHRPAAERPALPPGHLGPGDL